MWVSKGKRSLHKAFPWATPHRSPVTWWVISPAHVCLMEFPKAGGRLTGRNTLGASWGRWTSSPYLQSKRSGREMVALPRIQTEAKHRWHIRLTSHPWEADAGSPGVAEEMGCSWGESRRARNLSNLKKGHRGQSGFSKQGIVRKAPKFWAVEERCLVEMCSQACRLTAGHISTFKNNFF